MVYMPTLGWFGAAYMAVPWSVWVKPCWSGIDGWNPRAHTPAFLVGWFVRPGEPPLVQLQEAFVFQRFIFSGSM